MKQQKAQRIGSVLLVLAMVFQMLVLPVGALASEPSIVNGTSESLVLQDKLQDKQRTGGSLQAKIEEPTESPHVVDLTTEGTLDWLDLGSELSGEEDITKRDPSFLSFSAGGSLKQSQTNSAFLRNSAADDKNLSGRRFSRSFAGASSQFTLRVPATDQEQRTLSVYFAAWSGKVTLTATLGAETEKTVFDTTSQESGSISKAAIYTLDFTGTQEDEVLTLTGTLEPYDATYGNIALSAVTVSGTPPAAQPLEELLLSQNAITLLPEEVREIAFTTIPTNADTTEVTAHTGDESIVMIDENQRMVGKALGETEVWLEAGSVISNRMAVHVVDDDSPFDVNLAMNGTVIHADAPENSNFRAEKMLDGDYNTRYSTTVSGAGKSIVVDLGSLQFFNNINLYWEISYAKDYVLEVSKDNQQWMEVAEKTAKINYAPDIHDFDTVQARYIRLTTNRNVNRNNFSLFEFEVFRKNRLAEEYHISDISTGYGNLLPEFSSEIPNYEITVGSNVSSLDLTATIENPAVSDARLFIHEMPATSGQPVTVNLNGGETAVAVVSEDPNDPALRQEYIVTIYRLNYPFEGSDYQNLVALARQNPSFKVTSTVSGAWSPLSNLTDGNRYTVYQPSGGTSAPWGVTMDMGDNYMIDQVKFFSNRGSYLDQYDIYRSLDGIEWTKVATERSGNGEDKTYRFAPASARYIQLDGKKAVDFSSAAELEVYGVEITLDNIINTLQALEIARGQTELSLEISEDYEVTMVSSSHPDVIDIHGNIFPKKNQEQETEIVFLVKDLTTGATQNSPAISLTVPALVDVESISALAPIAVPYGTELADILQREVPRTLIVELSDGTTEELAVAWEEETTPVYDAAAPGSYTLTGQVELSDGITNDNAIDLSTQLGIVMTEAVVESLHIFPEAQTVPVPQGGKTKRSFFARLNSATGPIFPNVKWELLDTLEYVALEENMLIVTPSDSKAAGEMEQVRLRVTDEATGATATELVTLSFLPNGQSEPNPKHKDGYTLYHSSEFNDTLDRTAWSNYYLRHWATAGDEITKSDHYFEDGTIVLKIDEDTPYWSPMDGVVKCISLMSFEKPNIHDFHFGAGPSRNIPFFDGTATTKYGYFEMRAKLPAATDGSHMAWWMTGTTEDLNLFDTNSWASDQNMEIDVQETAFKEGQNNQWHSCYLGWGTTPVVTSETNGSRPQVMDPSLGRLDTEFHNYGLAWDEDGLSFYFDDEFVKRIDVEIDYRLLNYLGIYTNAWGGPDEGIYPKEFVIDYFRIYKQNESIGKPNDIYFDYSTVPQKVAIPAAGETATFAIEATVVDQMHTPVEATLEWYLARDKAYRQETTVPGVTIDRSTGQVIIDETVADGTLLRVSARVAGNDRIRQSYRIYVERKTEDIPVSIFFEEGQGIHSITIPTAGTHEIPLTATLYNQYLKPMADEVSYHLSLDTPGITPVAPTGVSVTADGTLRITDQAVSGEVFYVHAHSGDIHQNYIVELVSEDVPVKEHYTVRYDANGGVGTVVEQSAVVGEALTLATADSISKDGFTFDGWQHESTTYQAGEHFSWDIAETITMTARWKKIEDPIIPTPDPEVPDKPEEPTPVRPSAPSGGESSGKTQPVDTAPAVTQSGLKKQWAQKELVDYVGNLLQQGNKAPTVRMYQPQSITVASLQMLADTLRESLPMAQLQFDTMSGNAVEGRLMISLEKGTEFTGDVQLGVHTTTKMTNAIAALFERYFTNVIQVVKIDQETFETEVQVAVKADKRLQDIRQLYIYAYNPQSNTYRKLEETNPSLDANGYIHFTTTQGGYLILSQQPLKK